MSRRAAIVTDRLSRFTAYSSLLAMFPRTRVYPLPAYNILRYLLYHNPTLPPLLSHNRMLRHASSALKAA